MARSANASAPAKGRIHDRNRIKAIRSSHLVHGAGSIHVSSNSSRSTNQSVHLAYILENGTRSERNAAFFQLAAQQREPAHAGLSQFGEHSLCAKQKRFASAPERALGGVRPTIASPGDRQLNFDRSYLTWTTRIGAALSVPDLRGSSRCLAGSNRESRRLRGPLEI